MNTNIKEYTYIAFYNSKQIEIQAGSSYAAQLQAIKLFKPPKSKEHMVHVYLADRHINTTSIG